MSAVIVVRFLVAVVGYAVAGLHLFMGALGRVGRALVLVSGSVVIWVGLIVSVATWEKLQELSDDYTALMDGRERGSVTVLDRNGDVLGVRGQRFRRLTAEDADPALIDAVLSTEDRRFYWHLGFDPIGIVRAMLVNWRAGGIEQGGSTITQQVAKLAFLSSDRSYTRKLRELPYALALEWLYSKDEILSIYLNRAYLGGGAFGFEAAARRFFDRSARDLTAAQSAMLAGLLRAPSRWSPSSDFPAAQERARIILGAMRDNGAVSTEEHAAALVEINAIEQRQIREGAPHFVDWVEAQIPDALWERAPDLIVRTTFDPVAQEGLVSAVETVFAEMAGSDADAEAAGVILQSDGGIVAMMGGRDYGSSQFNRAAGVRRPLGSAFKPFVYTAALEAGVNPTGIVYDSPVSIRGWAPGNYSHRYRGPIPISRALAISSNVAAVRMMQQAGVDGVIDTARRFGFAGDLPRFPSIALGVLGVSPLEVASAYSVFPAQGRVNPAYGVTEVLNRGGDVLWRRQAMPARQAIDEGEAQWMTYMMRTVVTGGTGRRAQLENHEVAGKTGTTQDYRDAWFAGFTASHTGVVWMGRDDYTPLDGVTGGRIPAAIFSRAMGPLHEDNPVVALVPPTSSAGIAFQEERAAAAAAAAARAQATERRAQRRAERTRRQQAAAAAAAAAEAAATRRRDRSGWRSRWRSRDDVGFNDDEGF